MINKRSPIRVTSDCHGSSPGASRLELGPPVTHQTTRYANNLLEQSHRALKQRTRPTLGFKRFDSAARFCHAHDEVRHFLRFHPVGHRAASLAWQRRMRHQQLTLLRALMLAAYLSPPCVSRSALALWAESGRIPRAMGILSPSAGEEPRVLPL